LNDGRRNGELLLAFPIFSIMMYAANSTNFNNPISSDIDNMFWGMLYLTVVIEIILSSRRNSESFSVNVILPISMALIYIMYLLFFSHNTYLLGFHHLLYAVLVIILQEKLTRNIIKNNLIEVERENAKGYHIITMTMIPLITLFLGFAIATIYSPLLEKSLFTQSFVNFLATPPVLVWIVTYTCVVAYNYLMFRRLLSHAEYIEGSDD